MNTLIALLLASLSTAAALLLTHDQLAAIQAEGLAKTSLIGSLNTTGTLRAAVIKWQLDTGSMAVPSPEILVDEGYLEPEFLTAE